MSDDELPSSWLDLLRDAEGLPENILSLIGSDADPETEQIAERLMDGSVAKFLFSSLALICQRCQGVGERQLT